VDIHDENNEIFSGFFLNSPKNGY